MLSTVYKGIIIQESVFTKSCLTPLKFVYRLATVTNRVGGSFELERDQRWGDIYKVKSVVQYFDQSSKVT